MKHLSLRVLAVAILTMLTACATVGKVSATKIMADGNGNHIRLTEAPCASTAGALEQIPAELRAKMKAGSVYWQGKNYQACYTDYDDERYFVIDEAGDAGAVLKRAFKAETEV